MPTEPNQCTCVSDHMGISTVLKPWQIYDLHFVMSNITLHFMFISKLIMCSHSFACTCKSFFDIPCHITYTDVHLFSLWWINPNNLNISSNYIKWMSIKVQLGLKPNKRWLTLCFYHDLICCKTGSWRICRMSFLFINVTQKEQQIILEVKTIYFKFPRPLDNKM